jgi:thioesterase domain-containing protein
MSTPTPASAGSDTSDASDLSALEVEGYLHRNIPLSAAMGVRVKVATPRRVELTAPFAPNINHQATVFGGSASALAMLCAWTFVHLGLRREKIEAAIVIQRNSLTYDVPMQEDFVAVSTLADDAAWGRFVKTIERHGRGRIALTARLLCGGRQAASFEGDFVALRSGVRPSGSDTGTPAR